MRAADPPVGCARQSLGYESQAMEEPTFQWTWELEKDNDVFLPLVKYFSNQPVLTHSISP